MNRSVNPAVNRTLWLLLVLHSNEAFAHGEGYLLAGAATVAVLFGGALGVVASFRAPSAFPSYAHSLGLFLGLGGAIGWVTAGSSEGLALFLVFGGIGGALPLAVGYFAFKAIASWVRRLVAKRMAHPHEEA
jgi:hypothetical protein